MIKYFGPTVNLKLSTTYRNILLQVVLLHKIFYFYMRNV